MRTFLVKLAALLALAPAAVLADPTDEQVTAVWKAQQVNFEYRGYSTTYSCRSLEDKLEIILRTVGARENVRLQSYVCRRAARHRPLSDSDAVAGDRVRRKHSRAHHP